MKRLFLGLIAALMLASPAHACRYFDAYDSAVGRLYTIEVDPMNRPGVDFTFAAEDRVLECITRSAGTGVMTRIASCETGDGNRMEWPITWVQFDDDPMLTAAVFRGYVFYPGCDL